MRTLRCLIEKAACTISSLLTSTHIAYHLLVIDRANLSRTLLHISAAAALTGTAHGDVDLAAAFCMIDRDITTSPGHRALSACHHGSIATVAIFAGRCVK